MTLAVALKRYTAEVTPTKRPEREANSPRQQYCPARIGLARPPVYHRHQGVEYWPGCESGDEHPSASSRTRPQSPPDGRRRKAALGCLRCALESSAALDCARRTHHRNAHLGDSDAAQAASGPQAPRRSPSRNNKHVAAHRAAEYGGHGYIPLNHPVRPIDAGLIFYGEQGCDGKRRPYQFNPVWLNIKRKLKLTNVHFHDLRQKAIAPNCEKMLTWRRSFSAQREAKRANNERRNNTTVP